MFVNKKLEKKLNLTPEVPVYAVGHGSGPGMGVVNYGKISETVN